MAIYAISDLHLSLSTPDKPMNVFGDKWDNYEERVRENWLSKVKEEDIVILSGDFSWATYLEDAKADFKYLNDLPGKKYLLKGNHDYWWTTVKKMDEFIKANNFKDINFIYNNAYDIDDYILTGTRYWDFTDTVDDNEKIYKRELIRAEISLNKAKEISDSKSIIFTTHYLPEDRIIKLVNNYNVKKWIYGHIHTNYEDNIVDVENIDTYLTSCDYLNFDLKRID